MTDTNDVVIVSAGGTAVGQGANERIRKLNLYSWPQATLPQSYQAAQLIAQQWRQLGLEVEVKPLQRQAQTQLIWFSRDKWDTTMWRMVGRPERSDPDEFLYSLYHSSYAEKGYNFIGYLNPEYDEDRRIKAQAALAILVNLSPRSELEGMLGAQLIACHNAAMECFRQAADPAQQPQMRSENLAHAGRLSRAYAALVEALDRRRGESLPKTVTIEHRVIRGESDLTARAAHKGNGHALNGHTAPGGTALP